MARLKVANLSSTSTGVTATLALNGTTVTWSADPKLPTVAAPDILAITINPNTATAEVIYITAHTAGATTSTCLRLAEALGLGTGAAAAATAAPWAHAATVPDLTANFGGGSLLGSVNYRAATDAATYPIVTTATADVDATNLAVTFTTPPSGRVLVRVGATAGMAAAGNGFVQLREGTTVVATTLLTAIVGVGAVGAEFSVTGLVPGSAHTYKLGAYVSASTLNIYTGPTNGAVVIDVLDASAGGQGVGAASGVLRGDAGWTPVTYQNTWADSAGFEPASYRKDALGFVHLKGLPTSASAATVITTLPLGYRPAVKESFPNASGTGQVLVNADGTINPSAAQTLVAFDGITFLAAGETGQLHDGGGTGGVVTPLLGLTSYRNATDTTTYAITSTTTVDVDATNLAVTFTAPASGRVRVVAALTAGMLAAANGFAQIREGTAVLATALLTASTTASAESVEFLVTGLTPGSQHTYKLGAYVSASTLNILTGPTNGPVTLEVTDAGIGTAGTNLASPVNLLGITSYRPAADGATYTISVTADADVDAANLLVTFTAPQSGRVLVQFALPALNMAAAAVGRLTLREGTTTLQSSYVTYAAGITANPIVQYLVTGLTPGSVHTYKLGAYVSASNMSIQGGPTYGSFTLSVLDATVGLGGSGALVNSNKLATPVTYAAGADAATYAVAVGTVLADVDATNLAVTITAPPSGRIVIRAAAVVAAGASGVVFFGLREATTVVAGPSLATNSTAQVGVAKTFTISGLTPGSVHTYKLAAYATTAAGSIYTGPTNGQVVLEVEDAAAAAAGIGGAAHLISTGSVPAVANGAAAGTSPGAAVITGNDEAGTVTITTGTATTPGVLATITFVTPYASAPNVVLEPTNAAAAANVLQRFTTSTTTTFVINANAAPTVGVAHAWRYLVIG